MSNQNFNCFEYGKQGHIQADSPSLQNKNNFKGKKDIGLKKVYITWEDNEVSSIFRF